VQLAQTDRSHAVLLAGGVLAALLLLTHPAVQGAFFLPGMAEPQRQVSRARALAAGLLIGLAIVIDVVPGLFFGIGFGLYVLFYARSGRALPLFGLGRVPPLARMAYRSLVPRTNFTGACFGFRHYIGFAPIPAVYAARAYAAWQGNRAFRVAFCMAGLWSVYYAFLGTGITWKLMESVQHPAIKLLRPLRGF